MNNKMSVKNAEEVVRLAAGAQVLQCPICGYRSNGRILRGNFNGQRDTRVGAIIRHIRKEHNK